MREQGKCDICQRPIEIYQYLCREHYLLKEAAYGVNDLKQNKEDFREKAIERITEYVIFKMREDHYEYPLYWGPQAWWEQEKV